MINLSLSNLVGVASVTTLIGSGITLVMVNHMRVRVTRESYYQKAIVTLRKNSAAMKLIGEPMYMKKVDLSDVHNKFTPINTQLKVPFKGNNKKGDLYVWADRSHVSDDWTLRRLEIIFYDIYDKKVVVYKNEKN